jgi:hypothetical protein
MAIVNGEMYDDEINVPNDRNKYFIVHCYIIILIIYKL